PCRNRFDISPGSLENVYARQGVALASLQSPPCRTTRTGRSDLQLQRISSSYDLAPYRYPRRQEIGKAGSTQPQR
ncbi:hypothetical protein DOTSEDRAFT_75108, partial [Dothistroma septosporum NZE10]